MGASMPLFLIFRKSAVRPFPAGFKPKAARFGFFFCDWESILIRSDTVYNRGGQAMADKTSRIGAIVEVMLDTWDLPADCNEGELFTYAEALCDRIAAGENKDRLYAYLSEVQVDQLEMARSDAFRNIVDRALELSKGRT